MTCCGGRRPSAATRLLERSEREGRASDAARWARRALELSPDDEAALRRLLALLDRAGDRPAAIQAYEDFARRMAENLELEPAPETRALAESIRARAGRSAGDSAGIIAVLPFAIRGDGRFAYLGEGMVDLLATKLDGAGAIRAVDPRALLHFLNRSDLAPADAAGPPGGRAAAEHFDAGHYLLGALVEAGGKLQATASLYRRDGTAAATARATAGDESELFELVDEIVRQLLASQKIAPGTRLGRIAALTTESLDALRAYLQGERELRAGRYFDAMERFQAATEADPSFALAYYRLAAAAAGCALPDLAREFADQSDRHRVRLSPHDHLVLSAQRAWLSGAVGEAESLYATTTGTYPDDVEAWFHLGDLLFHSNPLRGRSAAEAKQPFQQGARPGAGSPGGDGAPGAHRGDRGPARRDAGPDRAHPAGEPRGRPGAGDAGAPGPRRARSRGDRAGRPGPGLGPRGHRGDRLRRRGALFGQSRRRRGAGPAVPRGSPALGAAGAVPHPAGPPGGGTRPVGRRPGRSWSAAQRLDHAWGLETRGLLATLPFAPADPARLRDLRAELAAWDTAAVPPSHFVVFAMHNDLHEVIRQYLLGLAALRSEELAEAAGHAAALARSATGDGGLADCLSAELSAAVARAQGRSGEALALLERSRPRLWFQLTVASPFFSLASRRFLQAELLRELGRTEEAAGWYESIAQRSPYELVFRRAAEERVEAMREAGKVKSEK